MKPGKPAGKRTINQGKKAPGRPAPAKSSVTPGNRANPAWHLWAFGVFIFVATMIVYSPALKNQFLKSWDDPVYVTGNKLLDSLSVRKIGQMFSFGTEFEIQSNNYHPVTTLSLALNKAVSGLNPGPWYFTNILLHSLNAVLVFFLVFLLAGRKKWAGLLAGLLFGLHPMHVESVAWISERKDVLYAFFFLGGLISYYYYLRRNSYGFLAAAFVMFLLSVLSKAMAVVFPAVLFLIDYLLLRKWSWRVILEKVPFFLLSLVFGMIAVRVQSQGAINDWQTFTLYQRFTHASYGFLSYIGSFVAPLSLSAFHPYPFITEHGELPLMFRMAPFLFIGIMSGAAGCLFIKKPAARHIAAGMLFYFFTVALVLQFLSVGKAITADRYTYLPYVGLSLIPALGVALLLEHGRPLLRRTGIALSVLLGCLVILFAVGTYNRAPVWHDDFTLWRNALEQYPDVRMNFIRVKLADLNFDRGEYQEALKDYHIMVSLDPKDDQSLEKIGRIWGQQFHQLDSAYIYYERANNINPDNLQLQKNLGVVYAMRGDFQKSLEIHLKAYRKDPNDKDLKKNISMTYRALGNPEKAKEFDVPATK